MLITPHFALSEFAQPALYGLPAMDYPQEWIADRLRPLCEVLEAVRVACGNEPITVIHTAGGGYRSYLWNELHHQQHPGVAVHSQHCEGRAADVRHHSLSALDLHRMILSLWRAGHLPALGGLGLYETFVHVDVRPHHPGELDRW